MIQCMACNAQIEDDSYFCDQCGAEIKNCMQCGAAGKGKRCTQCGGLMAAAKERDSSATGLPESPQTTHKKNISDQIVKEEKAVTATIPPDQMPVLTLSNKALNLSLVMEHNDIIGRRKGRHSSLLGAYNQISGEHAKVFYDNNMGWCITDLNSTNGTRIADRKLEPGTVHPLRDNSNIIIANIEFFIQIK